MAVKPPTWTIGLHHSRMDSTSAAIPIVILPLLAFVLTVLTQWIMLMISSVVLLGNGQNVAILWSRVGIFHRWPMLLFHFLCIHGLW